MSTVPTLHVVTNDAVLKRPDFISLAGQMAHSSTAIHLRSRTATGKALQQMISKLQDLAPHGQLLVNDRVDVAISMRTAGVHLPESGLASDEVRNICGNEVIIGKSTHSTDDARRAIDAGADYVFLGPVWQTSSHATRPAIGLEPIEATRDLCVIAIGGITVERSARCLEAGAHGVAAISAVWDHAQPPEVVRQFLSIIRDTDAVITERNNEHRHQTNRHRPERRTTEP